MTPDRIPARSVGMVLAALSFAPAARAQLPYSSDLVTSATPGHAVTIDVELRGAEALYLVVTDGGNGISCDWADWAEPRFVGPKGELPLTDLAWKSASAAWGQVRAGANAGGGPLRADGKLIPFGIGTHANSLIVYEIPEGYDRFRARGVLDMGGTSQGGGRATSVRFHVFGKKPKAKDIERAAPGTRWGGGGREPEAVGNLEVAEGLEATLFASEPMMLSPSNIDVDHRGRVWVCEVVNYRRHNGKRPEGDRILILEDTDGDGRADESKVYYQGRDVDSAMGICVLGNKVIVSCSPDILVFTDEDGDDKPDRKEKLFTKTGKPQDDHGAHTFVFGPDGRLYWNFGNNGRYVHDRDGKIVVDRAGHEIRDGGKPYWGGMVFRCELDGTGMEVLAHNFRNNYEVAVDSFGTLWQSDNDDDGNRAVRINYVMEGGNYGYREEHTGRGWREPRTNLEKEIPRRHWHMNDPGVVPNFVLTGAGSPCGILVYEGRLLPEVFWDQVIHADAGPSVVRAYPAERDGGRLSRNDGEHPRWDGRPLVPPIGRVCRARRFALRRRLVRPGVGGHAMGDLGRGRIFRVAPPAHPYRPPELNVETPEGAATALRSPNLAARYLAWSALAGMGRDALPVLEPLLTDDNPRIRVRVLWLWSAIDPGAAIERASSDPNDDVRATALRIARRHRTDVIPLVVELKERCVAGGPPRVPPRLAA